MHDLIVVLKCKMCIAKMWLINSVKLLSLQFLKMISFPRTKFCHHYNQEHVIQWKFHSFPVQNKNNKNWDYNINKNILINAHITKFLVFSTTIPLLFIHFLCNFSIKRIFFRSTQLNSFLFRVYWMHFMGILNSVVTQSKCNNLKKKNTYKFTKLNNKKRQK